MFKMQSATGAVWQARLASQVTVSRRKARRDKAW
jgi:hypothetical protein